MMSVVMWCVSASVLITLSTKDFFLIVPCCPAEVVGARNAKQERTCGWRRDAGIGEVGITRRLYGCGSSGPYLESS